MHKRNVAQLQKKNKNAADTLIWPQKWQQQ